MKISRIIRNLWREVEDILTAATGPILIVASAMAAADIFSNHVFSNQYTWIPAAWAVARALAVTIWLGIAWEFYLRARGQEGGGGWWLLLALALFAVDLQTALLFAIEDEHIATVGTIPLVTIPPMYWAFEQAILGVVLIAVHRAVDHQTHTPAAAAATPAVVTALAPVRQNTQPIEDGSAILRREAPVGPLTRRAYWDGPRAPLTTDEGTSGMYELVSTEDQGEQEPGLTRQTPRTTGRRMSGRPRRRDAGSESSAKEQRVQRLMAQLRVDPGMTIEEVAEFLDVSRGTAVTDRREAKQRLAGEKSL